MKKIAHPFCFSGVKTSSVNAVPNSRPKITSSVRVTGTFSAASAEKQNAAATKIILNSCDGFMRLEQAVNRDSEHTERSLIFQTFRCLLDFLQSHLRIIEERFVIHQLAHAALALVYLGQNPVEIRHGRGRFRVKLLIVQQFAEAALALIDAGDRLLRFTQGELRVVKQRLQVSR